MPTIFKSRNIIDNLVSAINSRWKLESNADDSVGSNDGTIVSATGAGTDVSFADAGGVDAAIFTGGSANQNTNGRISLPTAATDDFNFEYGSGTISFWARPSSTSTFYMLSDYAPSSDPDGFAFWQATDYYSYKYDEEGSRVRLLLLSSPSTDGLVGSVIAASDVILTSNNWVHVCYVKNHNVNRLYINGELAEEKIWSDNRPFVSSASSLVPGSTRNVGIGSQTGGNGQRYPGAIKDVIVVKGYAASSLQVKQLYLAGNTAPDL